MSEAVARRDELEAWLLLDIPSKDLSACSEDMSPVISEVGPLWTTSSGQIALWHCVQLQRSRLVTKLTFGSAFAVGSLVDNIGRSCVCVSASHLAHISG